MTELFAVALIALLVLGPEELVRQSQRAGRMAAKFRTQANNFKIMMQAELESEAEKKTPLENGEPRVPT